VVRSLRAVGSPGGRGRLHVYLGTAPAVGKSYAMLGEGRRLAASGTDVVVGYLESHSDEADLFLDALLVVPPKAVSYRGTTFTEMDLDAILLRSPRVVLVDELAHSNAPGQRHAKRWQDVEELLDAGIDVISNLNVQHLDSLHDEVERLTAVPQRETVPDIVVASADRVELIDLEPEALRERVKRRTDSASTNSEVALGRWFTVENINALHDLAVSWMARHARSDEPGQPAPPRASVVVSLDAGRRGDELVRRAAQIARRDDARLIGVHVCVPTGLRESDNGLESRRRLLAELGGNYAEVGALDRGDTLMIFAADQRATEVVVGSPKRTRVHRLLHGAELDRLVEAAPGGIELHVVAIDDGPPAPLPESSPTPRPRLSPRRRLIAWAVALIGPVAVTFSLTPWRASLGLAGVLLALLLVTAATAAVGGLAPSLAAAALALALADFLYAVPYHSFRVDRLVDLVGLLAFAGVAVIVSVLVHLATRASLRAVQTRAEAEGVTRLAAAALPHAIGRNPDLLEELRTVFGLDSVALMTRAGSGSSWSSVHAAGLPVPAGPDDGSAVLVVGADSVLVLTGGELPEAGTPLLRELVNEMSRSDARAQLSRLREGGRSPDA